uniref:Uncharacterized protein n=1 Tax=Romanomermis culicivorax TaxID=13658 RepID=A0A915IW34_ROMCU
MIKCKERDARPPTGLGCDQGQGFFPSQGHPYMHPQLPHHLGQPEDIRLLLGVHAIYHSSRGQVALDPT